MTYDQTTPARPDDPEQTKLMLGLLDGHEPDAYVVIPVGALLTQMEMAVRETTSRDGRARTGKAAVRLIRSLNVLGWIIDTAHPHQDQS